MEMEKIIYYEALPCASELSELHATLQKIYEKWSRTRLGEVHFFFLRLRFDLSNDVFLKLLSYVQYKVTFRRKREIK